MMVSDFVISKITHDIDEDGRDSYWKTWRSYTPGCPGYGTSPASIDTSIPPGFVKVIIEKKDKEVVRLVLTRREAAVLGKLLSD